ncbi:MAG TPA: quinol:cytochrome C oxidoreductase, partial [Planctomycetota bacterium]|nr:quinol:cytochrome C oxidoreductase [Planctomycetota bacterium]
VDLFWLIMPNYDSHHLHWPVLELLCLLSAGGVFTFFFLGSAANHALTPVKDPRLAESLAFENI